MFGFHGTGAQLLTQPLSVVVDNVDNASIEKYNGVSPTVLSGPANASGVTIITTARVIKVTRKSRSRFVF